MSRTAGRRLTLAASLLLGGCYVGLDLADRDASTGGSSTTDPSSATTADPTTTDPTADPMTEPTTEPTTDPGGTTTGVTSEDGTSGGIEGTTGDDTTPMTTGPGTGDPGTTSTSTTGDDTTGGADTGMPPPLDVPDTAYCADVAGWSPAWAQLELDVLVIVNQVRSQGANCGTKGAFGPAGPLTMDLALRCAARKHSADMAARNFFDHTNPDGLAPWDRMTAAGYDWSTAGENIAAGSPDAQGTMSQWMGSDGHCANIMNPAFKDIGVGYSTGGQYGHLWTQVFGAK